MMMLYMLSFLMYLIISSSIDALIQDFYWRDYAPGDIPCDAFEGAPGIYIGQFIAKHDDRIHLQAATIYAHANIAATELYGKQTATENVKILCSPKKFKFYWEFVDFDDPNNGQLKNAVKGGYEYYNTYIGKILHEKEWKIGKVIPFEGKGGKGIWVWDAEDRAVQLRQFFVMKYNMSDTC